MVLYCCNKSQKKIVGCKMIDKPGLYKIDFPSGKSYIGFSAISIEKRVAGHFIEAKNMKQKSNTALSRAIRKYGRRNCKIHTLAISKNKKKLSYLEVKAIAFYKTMKPYGYNLTIGGEGGAGYKHLGKFKKEAKIRGKFFAKKRWKDKNSKYNTSEYRAKKSKEMKKYWKLNRDKILAYFRTEECSKKRAKAKRKNWNDPEYRKKLSRPREKS